MLSARARLWGLPVADVVLAAVLLVYAELDVFLSGEWHGNHSVTGVVVAFMAASLAWRRTAPIVTLAVPVCGLVLLSLVYEGSETGANLFILLAAIYSVALYGRDPLAAYVVYMVMAVVHTASTPEVNGAGDWLWEPMMVTLAFGVGYVMRGRQARTDALEDRAGELEREREQRAAEAAAEERQRIARELHDVISHSLGVMVLQAGAADQVVDRDPARAREVLASIRATGQEAIGEMSTLLGLIRPDEPGSLEPQPSLSDIASLVARTSEAGLPTELEIEGNERPLPAALELSAYRIVQEGLTNAMKHAGPAHARVTVRYGADELRVEVADDGAAAQNGNGNGRGGRRGLAGIAERVSVFGGQLDAGPRADGGWTVSAGFPIPR